MMNGLVWLILDGAMYEGLQELVCGEYGQGKQA